MNTETSDILSKAYHRLKALRSNLPDSPYVEESWVKEYDAILSSISDVLDLKVFKVLDEYLVHLDQNPIGADILASYRGEDYVPDRTTERYVGKKTFCIKLDAVLSYVDEVRKSSRED